MPTNLEKLEDFSSRSANFKGQGASGTATAGATTSIDYKIPTSGDKPNRLLTGLEILLKDHAFGDHAKLQVVDVDNIIGLGAGAVLGEYATEWYFDDTKRSQGPYHVSYFTEINAGLYLRISYTSVGGTNVSVKVNYYLHKALV